MGRKKSAGINSNPHNGKSEPPGGLLEQKSNKSRSMVLQRQDFYLKRFWYSGTLEQPSIDGVYLYGLEHVFYNLVSEELDHYLQQEDMKTVLLFPPVSSRMRYIIHRLAEPINALSSFSVGEGWQRRTVICHSGIRLPDPEGESRSSTREPNRGWNRGDNVNYFNKSGKGKSGWRQRKNERPDRSFYVPKGRYGWRARGESRQTDGERKNEKPRQWERRSENSNPVEQRENGLVEGDAKGRYLEEKAIDETARVYSSGVVKVQVKGEFDNLQKRERVKNEEQQREIQGEESRGESGEEKKLIRIEHEEKGEGSQEGKERTRTENNEDKTRESVEGKIVSVENEDQRGEILEDEGERRTRVERGERGEEEERTERVKQDERTKHGPEANEGKGGNVGPTLMLHEAGSWKESEGMGATNLLPETGDPESIREAETPVLSEKGREGEDSGTSEKVDNGECRGGESTQAENSDKIVQGAQCTEGDGCAYTRTMEVVNTQSQDKATSLGNGVDGWTGGADPPLCVADGRVEQEDQREEGTTEPAPNNTSLAEGESVMLEQIMKEISAHVCEEDVRIQPLLGDFSMFNNIPTDHGKFGHIIEVYGFSTPFHVEDLMEHFTDYRERGLRLQWVDDDHTLAIFSSPEDAYAASCRTHPSMKFRPLSQGTRLSKLQAHEYSECFQTYKKRPETETTVAKRMLRMALGLVKQDEERGVGGSA
ncbi:R3H and coiled-coil domain-containing protein 1 [Rhinophrynus dorsalis]